MISNNSTLKAALKEAKAKKSAAGSDTDVRMPVNIPAAYKNRLKLMAVVEDTTMRALVIEALEDLFRSRDLSFEAEEGDSQEH